MVDDSAYAAKGYLCNFFYHLFSELKFSSLNVSLKCNIFNVCV